MFESFRRKEKISFSPEEQKIINDWKEKIQNSRKKFIDEWSSGGAIKKYAIDLNLNDKQMKGIIRQSSWAETEGVENSGFRSNLNIMADLEGYEPDGLFKSREAKEKAVEEVFGRKGKFGKLADDLTRKTADEAFASYLDMRKEFAGMGEGIKKVNAERSAMEKKKIDEQSEKLSNMLNFSVSKWILESRKKSFFNDAGVRSFFNDNAISLVSDMNRGLNTAGFSNDQKAEIFNNILEDMGAERSSGSFFEVMSDLINHATTEALGEYKKENFSGIIKDNKDIKDENSDDSDENWEIPKSIQELVAHFKDNMKNTTKGWVNQLLESGNIGRLDMEDFLDDNSRVYIKLLENEIDSLVDNDKSKKEEVITGLVSSLKLKPKNNSKRNLDLIRVDLSSKAKTAYGNIKNRRENKEIPKSQEYFPNFTMENVKKEMLSESDEWVESALKKDPEMNPKKAQKFFSEKAKSYAVGLMADLEEFFPKKRYPKKSSREMMIGFLLDDLTVELGLGKFKKNKDKIKAIQEKMIKNALDKYAYYTSEIKESQTESTTPRKSSGYDPFGPIPYETNEAYQEGINKASKKIKSVPEGIRKTLERKKPIAENSENEVENKEAEFTLEEMEAMKMFEKDAREIVAHITNFETWKTGYGYREKRIPSLIEAELERFWGLFGQEMITEDDFENDERAVLAWREVMKRVMGEEKMEEIASSWEEEWKLAA